MLIARTRRSLLRLVLEQHDFTKSLAVLWTFCENGAKCQQSTLLARLGNHRRSAETARGLAYACKTYLDGIRLIRDRRKKPVLLQKPAPDAGFFLFYIVQTQMSTIAGLFMLLFSRLFISSMTKVQPSPLSHWYTSVYPVFPTLMSASLGRKTS